jgi:hypothetical protein
MKTSLSHTCRDTFIPPPKKHCSQFSVESILNHVGLQTVYYQFPVSNFTLLTNLLGHTGHRAMKTYPEDKLPTEETDIEYVQYADLKKNTCMKTLIQEAPIVNTSTTPASEDTRSQLQHAVINHLTKR